MVGCGWCCGCAVVGGGLWWFVAVCGVVSFCCVVVWLFVVLLCCCFATNSCQMFWTFESVKSAIQSEQRTRTARLKRLQLGISSHLVPVVHQCRVRLPLVGVPCPCCALCWRMRSLRVTFRLRSNSVPRSLLTPHPLSVVVGEVVGGARDVCCASCRRMQEGPCRHMLIESCRRRLRPHFWSLELHTAQGQHN